MFYTYLITIFIILLVLGGWIAVQHLARRFAEKHPEFGPPREEDASCGFFCLCNNRDTCLKKDLKQEHSEKH